MPGAKQTDPKRPDSRVVIQDFAGFVANSDPHDLPPGAAQVQVNVTPSVPGELRVRQGYQVVRFDG
jgi:hypothetical protein